MQRLLLFGVVLVGSLFSSRTHADDAWLTLPGGEGPGKGKHIVLISGDEEYRSEEALPQLAKILSKHHGFKCTVLFAIDPKTGEINPNQLNNIPGLESVHNADLVVMFLRMRDLPDDQLKHLADYTKSGKPIMGLRTSTHAFQLKSSKTYADYDFRNKAWDGGYGRKVFGETWISHHGAHGKQATRGIIASEEKTNPILRGIADGDIFGPSDVYGVRLPMPSDCKPLVLGQVVDGMKLDDKPLAGKKNDPMMPIAWTKSHDLAEGKSPRVFATTMGASQDLSSEGLRRLLVNGCYWCLGMENQIPAKSVVDIVGKYEPSPFKFGGYVKGKKPADLGKDS